MNAAGDAVLVWKNNGGHELGFLGAIEVAVIAPWSHPDRRLAAVWTVYLPGCPHVPRHAVDAHAAKQLAEARAKDWIEAAGLAPAPRADQVRAWRSDAGHDEHGASTP